VGNPTVLALRDDDPRFDDALAQFVAAHPSTIVITPIEGTGPLATRTCAAITRQAPEPPLVLVAFGTATLTLPAVALAQRSAHRRVLEYLLVEPALPPVGDSWPDAPVTIADRDDSVAARQGVLRGWDVIPTEAAWTWAPAD
jgi:hypothetical protein